MNPCSSSRYGLNIWTDWVLWLWLATSNSNLLWEFFCQISHESKTSHMTPKKRDVSLMIFFFTVENSCVHLWKGSHFNTATCSKLTDLNTPVCSIQYYKSVLIFEKGINLIFHSDLYIVMWTYKMSQILSYPVVSKSFHKP